ncbi:glycosyltransferase [Planomonospora alba]|uniref:Glycosyltransferase n=1 Tax=Planomonospora alba TaxID=161354 RepID=A0ABP6MXW5_9ACTN
MSGSARLVFVSVGTDHHPFARLVEWADAWAAKEHGPGVRCVVQHGRSPAPRVAEGHAYLEHGELTALMAEASVVVCHGGPTTIAESRRRGLLPIVVPRSPRLGEHVDDHQERFCARLAASGLIAPARDEAHLHELIDRALADPEAFRAEAGTDSTAAAVRRFGDLVDDLLAARAVRRGSRPRSA